MAFVKLDCGILNSTLWIDREAREAFITALLMAVPREFPDPQPQLCVRSLEHSGWEIPSGWYGFVPAAGIGIINAAKVEREAGLSALERLGDIDPESRSQAFEGRRLVRVEGGYLVLNYMPYRERDYTNADRVKRYRERVKSGQTVTPRTVTSPPRHITSPRDNMHADADAEGYKIRNRIGGGCKGEDFALDHGPPSPPARVVKKVRNRTAMTADHQPIDADIAYAIANGPADADWPATWEHFRDHHLAKGTLGADWSATWRTWVAGITTRGFSYARKPLELSARPEPVQISHLEHRRIKAGESLADILASR